jgi:predicted dehydrogenase
MIRLAISGASEAVFRDVAARLRGAILQSAPADADAVAFIGAESPEPELVERLLAAGRPVLLASETLPAETLERLAAAGRLAVLNPDRYLPSRRLIRQQLDAGNLGEVGLVRLHRWEPAAAETAGLPAGLVRDLDLVVWLVDRLPELVYAVTAGRVVQVHLGFPGGGMALIDHCDGLPVGDGYTALSVIGSSGAVSADDHNDRQLVFRGGCPLAVRTGEGTAHLAVLVQQFVDDLQAGRDLSGSVAAWRDVLAVAGAVRRSLDSRRAVPLEGR